MAGWVGEWCSDFYGVRYMEDDVIDPKGPTEEDLTDASINPWDAYGVRYHVLRRGLGTTVRDAGNEVDEDGTYGFRIVVEAPVDKRGEKDDM